MNAVSNFLKISLLIIGSISFTLSAYIFIAGNIGAHSYAEYRDKTWYPQLESLGRELKNWNHKNLITKAEFDKLNPTHVSGGSIQIFCGESSIYTKDIQVNMARSDYQTRCDNKGLKGSTIRSDIELTELKNIYDSLVILERTSQQEQKNIDSIFLTKSGYLDMDFGISMAIVSILSFLIAFIMRFFKNS